MASLRDGTRYKHNYPPLAVHVAGEDMPFGSAVCQSKRSKNMIMQADADDESRMPCIGVLLESKLLGQEAEVVPFGLFVNPQRDSDFQPGAPIYVSTNRGKFTRVQPSVGTIQVVGEARNENSALFYCIPPQIPVSYGYSETGNHTITPADVTDEIKFGEDFGVWHHGMLWVEFDLSNLIADAPITVTARLYHKIDGTNLKQICRKHSLVGTDEDHLTLYGAVTAGQTIQLSLQVSKAVGADRVVNHVFIQDT
jgi:hypothetical protein